jgi:hypothetical protein
MGHQAHGFMDDLGDEHPVKWVLVRRQQHSQRRQMVGMDGQLLDNVLKIRG